MSIDRHRGFLRRPNPAAPIAAAVFLLTAAAPAVAGEAARLASSFDQGRLLAFAGLFLVGLALNLTPCVYPMLAITVSIFGARSGKSSATIFGRALVYVLGIATMYSVLGAAAALTGGLFGGILQSGAVLFGIGALFILLALSMFGLYELRPPAGLMNRLGAGRTAGWAGTYLSGLFVGIFAAPCIGPPIIGLLALVGRRGDPVFGFAAFFVLSLGLGFPYLILGTFSGLLNRLPRSGEWMIWVRKLLGVALTAVGVFYLSLALDPGLVFVLIPLVLVAGGVYLGLIEKSGSRARLFPWIKRLAGAGFVIAAVVIYRGGRLPSLDWEPYDDKLVADSLREGLPTMIYFSADWCVPCLELDRRTFTDRRVIQELRQLPRFKVDLTSYESPEAVRLRNLYGIAGVPTIVFLDGRGEEITGERIVGFVRADRLVEKLDRVKAATGEALTETAADEEPGSTARLIADVKWIRPGDPFQAGVLFQMNRGWHVYWLNPGDSGTAPRMEWTLPEGFVAGEVEWPAPRRFDEPPFVTFGLEGEMLVSRKLTPPAGLEAGDELRLEVKTSWLACKDYCVGFDDHLELVIPVGDRPPEPSRWRSAFERAEALRPVADPRWDFSARMDAASITLDVRPPAEVSAEKMKRAEFFPAPAGVVRSERRPWEEVTGGYRLRMLREGPEPEPVFDGVLVVPAAKEGEKQLVLTVEAELFLRSD